MVQWLLWVMNDLHVYFELKTGQTITLRYERPKYLLWAMDDPNISFELRKSQNVYFELRMDQMFTLNYKWLNVYLELWMVQCLLWAKNDPNVYFELQWPKCLLWAMWDNYLSKFEINKVRLYITIFTMWIEHDPMHH